MADKRHYEKWLWQAPLGLLLCGAAVIFIFYSLVYEHINTGNWLMWGLITATIFMGGMGLLVNAIIHKVKADISRKKKSRSGNGSDSADM